MAVGSAEHFSDAKLNVVGSIDSVPERQLRDMSAIHGVYFHGFVNNLLDAYRGNSLAVIPINKNCGIVNKAIEAMAAGVLPIGFRKAFEGIPQAKNGVHFLAAESYEEIGELICLALTDQRRRAICNKLRSQWLLIIMPGHRVFHCTKTCTKRRQNRIRVCAKRLTIILNFLPLKTGGGVQVALDFLRNLRLSSDSHNWYLVCRANTPFREEIADSRIRLIHEVKDNLLARGLFELLLCRRIIKEYQPDVVYTQFGPQWLGVSCLQIVGCAYSNLFYPEIDFWRGLPRLERYKKAVIDKVRLQRLLNADIRIFETEDLSQRAIKQFNLNPDTVHFVRPAASALVAKNKRHDATARRCQTLPYGYKVLLLSGYHPNKNIEFLVDTADYIEASDPGNDVVFVLTLPANEAEVRHLMEEIELRGLQHRVFNFGPVPQEACCELYRHCQAAILPSTLESFSNMIAESWAMDRPLLISDLSWSRNLCGNGAVYFEYLNPVSLVQAVMNLREDPQEAARVVAQGRRMLANYPDSMERFRQYLQIIENSCRNNQCPR